MKSWEQMENSRWLIMKKELRQWLECHISQVRAHLQLCRSRLPAPGSSHKELQKSDAAWLRGEWSSTTQTQIWDCRPLRWRKPWRKGQQQRTALSVWKEGTRTTRTWLRMQSQVSCSFVQGAFLLLPLSPWLYFSSQEAFRGQRWSTVLCIAENMKIYSNCSKMIQLVFLPSGIQIISQTLTELSFCKFSFELCDFFWVSFDDAH